MSNIEAIGGLRPLPKPIGLAGSKMLVEVPIVSPGASSLLIESGAVKPGALKAEKYNPRKLNTDLKLSRSDVLNNVTRIRRSGCRCVDKENKDTAPCKSRFCEKKRAKTEFNTGKKPDRSVRKGLLIRFPRSSKLEKSNSPQVQKTTGPRAKAA